MLNPEILASIDALQVKYVRALDRRDMKAWLGCFAKDGSGYVCTSAENEQQNLPIAIMMDDCYARLADRVKFVTEVWAGTFEDYSTRHFVQRLQCMEKLPGVYAVESNLLVTYIGANRRSEVLATGIYEDEVVVEAGVAAFKSKKALLDTVTTPRYLVYPI